MKFIKNFNENYGGEEFHRDDFGSESNDSIITWDKIKQELYVGSRQEDDNIDSVIDELSSKYNVPTKKSFPNTKGTYPGPTNR